MKRNHDLITRLVELSDEWLEDDTNSVKLKELRLVVDQLKDQAKVELEPPFMAKFTSDIDFYRYFLDSIKVKLERSWGDTIVLDDYPGRRKSMCAIMLSKMGFDLKYDGRNDRYQVEIAPGASKDSLAMKWKDGEYGTVEDRQVCHIVQEAKKLYEIDREVYIGTNLLTEAVERATKILEEDGLVIYQEGEVTRAKISIDHFYTYVMKHL
jgi:hypothetical protein